MKNFFISKSRRIRSTPFTSRIEKQGVKNYTVYNHMLLPTTFSTVEEDLQDLSQMHHLQHAFQQPQRRQQLLHRFL